MKVFGVGYRRSGSRSMCAALNQLGVKSIHWECPDGRKLPEVINRNLPGQDKLLHSVPDDIIGFFDYPIYRYYTFLDLEYPGSKFISTYRSPDAIADSWQRKMDREGWCSNVTDQYGVYRPTAADCREDAKRHYNNVSDYFKGRSDFLQFSTGDMGWTELAAFLGFEGRIPTGAFPCVRH